MKKGNEDTCNKETVPIWTQQRQESLQGARSHLKCTSSIHGRKRRASGLLPTLKLLVTQHRNLIDVIVVVATCLEDISVRALEAVLWCSPGPPLHLPHCRFFSNQSALVCMN